MEDWGQTLLLLLSGAATMIGAISAFRSGETSSKSEQLRTQLELERVIKREPVDSLIQNAQNVNMMASNLNERLVTREMYLQGQLDTRQQELDTLKSRISNVELCVRDLVLNAEYLAEMIEAGNGSYPEKVHSFAQKVLENTKVLKETF